MTDLCTAVTVAVTATVMVIAIVFMARFYMEGCCGEKFSIRKGARMGAEAVKNEYYRELQCKFCPIPPDSPMWQNGMGDAYYCSDGCKCVPLVVLHSDGDGVMEEMFIRALRDANVNGQIVRDRRENMPYWITSTPCIFMWDDESLYKYNGPMCADGIFKFATQMWGADWQM